MVVISLPTNYYQQMAGQVQGQAEKPEYGDLVNGPYTEASRECRDMICCVIYLLALVTMVYLTATGYANGNPNNIFRPLAHDYTTATLVTCGDPNGPAANYPYTYFSNPLDIYNKRYCVQSCPSLGGANMVSSPHIIYDSTGQTLTFTVFVNSTGSFSSTPTSSDQIGYDSELVINRICLPSTTVFNTAFSTITSTFAQIQQGDLGNFIVDLKNNWPLLIAAVGFAVVVSFMMMYFLRCCAGCIVWMFLIGVVLVLALGGIVFLYNAGTISGVGSYSGYLSIPNTSASQPNYKAYGIVCFVLSGVFLLIILCCCSRIRLAVAVCKAAGQFVGRVCQVMLVPIYQALILIFFWAACIVVMIYLVSAATFYQASPTDFFSSVQSYSDPNLNRFYVFVFLTLWSNAMIQAIGVFVIASACAMWYFSHGPNDTLDSPIIRSYKMVFRYHFGSLAFGSLVLAIIQFMQLIVQVLKKQGEQAAPGNKCMQYLTNCVACCLACVERIVQFINKTAYIQIAIRGKNFCMAAKDGFQMVWSNGLRYTVVSGIGEVLMFMGKLCIALLTTGAFYLLILYNPASRINVLQPIFMLIIVFIIAYAIGLLFMAVYAMAMDTLLACFIIDESSAKAKGTKPQHAPAELADVMESS